MNGAILAGGTSRRMGGDKAAIRLGGLTMLERVTRAATQALRRVIIVGRERPDVGPTAGSGPRGVSWPEFVPDDEPGLGPLGGLRTALRHLQSDLVLLACDLPGLTADVVGWLVEQGAGDSHRDGMVALKDGRLQPLFAIYRAPVLTRVEARLASEDNSLHGLIDSGDFGRADVPQCLSSALFNVNTPDDLVTWRVESGRRDSEEEHESL